MVKGNIIYFSINNWFYGRDFPPIQNICNWLSSSNPDGFQNSEWCKKNKLCVYWGNIDMSINYTVAAPREWVEENCPELLTDDEYTYKVQYYRSSAPVTETRTKKYSNFVYNTENGESAPDSDWVEMPFPEYREENFGSEYYETHWWECDEDDSDDDEEEFGESDENESDDMTEHEDRCPDDDTDEAPDKSGEISGDNETSIWKRFLKFIGF